jgi:phage/plasmid-like protein (TIGR03299 family)
MAANVETMFYVREKPWHGLGVRVEETLTSADALRVAGLDWTIESRSVLSEDGEIIPGYKANTRSSDRKVMGIVSDRYAIVQNAEAFSFTDALIGDQMRYETAGSLCGGKKIWLLGKMPDRYILGDRVEPYICFTNTHDGTGAVRVCMTPVRVVCNNTLNIALRDANRSWSARHIGDMSAKLEEARQTLELADIYLESLAEKADEMANSAFNEDEAKKVLDQVIEVNESMSDRQKQTAQNVKDGIVACMFAPDLVKFLNTKWGFVNAVADYADHGDPVRHTKDFEAHRWDNIIGGHWLLDKVTAALAV